MSVKSELDNIVSNLRETRKAILGRGGEISTTAGLKDLPSAIYNIPADASLSFYEDSSLAYEKIVPSNAEEYAALVKVGGLSIPNNNLCIADGYYEIKDEMSHTFEFGELEVGEYYFKFEGNITGMGVMSVYGEAALHDRSSNPCVYGNILTVVEKSSVSLTLFSTRADSNPEEPEWDTYPLLNGTITGIMLCNDSDTDASYKPFSKTSNLCRADRYYDLTSRTHDAEGQHLLFDLNRLEEGVYQLTWFGKAVTHLASVEAYGGYVVKKDAFVADNNYIFGVTEESSDVSASLSSVCGFDAMYDRPEAFPDWERYCWSGMITGIMLVKLSDTCNGIEDVRAANPIADLEYEPYVGSLLHIKPKSIESRGIQMLPYPYAETTKTDQGLTFTDNGDGTITINGVIKKNYNTLYIEFKFNTDLHLEDGKTYYLKNISSTIPVCFVYNVDYGENHAFVKSLVWKSSYRFRGIRIALSVGGNYPIYQNGDVFDNVLVTPILSETPIPDDITTNIRFEDKKELPEAVMSLKGWGLGIDAEYNNHIEWRNGRIFYVRMLDELDLGDFTWRFFKSTSYFVTYPEKCPEIWENIDLPKCTGYELGIALCANYEVQPAYTISGDVSLDKTVGYINPNTTYGRMIYVRNNAYTSVKDIKNALKGEKFIYPLATPIETDITHLFTDTSPFLKVQGGGSIILHNRYNRAVPSTIKYTVKVGI